jgi:hypothetical protein
MENVEDGGIVALLVVAPRLSRHLQIIFSINAENSEIVVLTFIDTYHATY